MSQFVRTAAFTGSSALLLLSAIGCAPGDTPPAHGPARPDAAALTASSLPWAQGIAPSPAYVARQAEYLAYCAANSGPGQGSVYGQICRLALSAGPLNEDVIRASIDKINAREDTADFGLNGLLRLIALYKDHPDLDPGLQAEIIDAIINFKYWLDEPGPDEMCWWSENHQVLFHTAELVAGQLFPDTVFPNAGLTGAEHVAKAIPMLREWLDRRGVFGFSEWHSNIYFNEDMPALLNLVDFAQDVDIATRAAMVLDLVSFDMANTYYKGVFATVHGRTYDRTKIGGSDDSTAEAAWLLLNQGTYRDTGNFSAVFFATSPRYWVPDLLEQVALDASSYHEHRQRDGIDVAEGPDWGIGYTDYEDVMFWWGMGAYASSQVIEGTFYTVDYYDLWDDFFWSSVAFLQPLVGAPWLEPASAALDDFTRGSALEAMSTYVYRTPDYQLSGAQDFNPGLWGAQQHMWQATLDPNAVVFTTYPGGNSGDYFAGLWTGGWLPRALFYENVGVIRYERERYPLADQAFFVEYTHAYFPRTYFDEVTGDDHWTFGRKGSSYVALYSQNPVVWATAEPEKDYELIADGISNVWIVELGSTAESGDFANFVASISGTTVWISGPYLEYESPSQGTIAASTTGPLFVNGDAVDTGPYERWENRYAQQDFGTNRTEIRFGGRQLELDFSGPTRRIVQASAP